LDCAAPFSAISRNCSGASVFDFVLKFDSIRNFLCCGPQLAEPARRYWPFFVPNGEVPLLPAPEKQIDTSMTLSDPRERTPQLAILLSHYFWMSAFGP
jgi:hypothetical protein